jgi:hypothetical protein
MSIGRIKIAYILTNAVETTSQRANLSMVIEEKPDLEKIYPLIDKPYYVDQIRYKIE